MKKRLFSLLLVLTLCFTLLPLSAAAEGEEEMVTVTFDMCGHGGEAPASVTVPKGSKIAAPESPKPDEEDGVYYFAHWTAHPVSGAPVDAWDFDTMTVEETMTLYAVWWRYTEVTMVISHSGGPYKNGSVEFRDSSGNVYPFTEGDSHEANTDYICHAVKPGIYQLYIESSYADSYTLARSGSSAKWWVNFFHVSFDANGQKFMQGTAPESITAFGGSCKVSRPVSSPKAQDSSYVFAGWTVGPEADSSEFDFSSSVTGETVIYAQWTKDAPEDSVLVTVERSALQGSHFALKGEDYHAVLVPDAGYKLPYRAANGSYKNSTCVFIGGSVLDASKYSLNCATGEITIPGEYVTDSIHIQSNPRVPPFTVTFDANGGSGVQAPLLAYPYEGGYDYYITYPKSYATFRTPECIFTPPDGMVFDKWDGKYTDQGRKIIARSDITLKALWKEAPAGVYTVAFDLNGCTFSGKTTTQADADYSARLAPADGYAYPITLRNISIGGTVLGSGKYSYDPATGILTIPAAAITGNIVISAAALMPTRSPLPP